MDLEAFLTAALPHVSPTSARAVLALVADGATVPFLARYRKERTGNLDEASIRAVLEAKQSFDAVMARQGFIVDEIERQRKLLPELRERVLSTFDREVLEDLYLPYKRKRQDPAGVARDAGLEPLADWIWGCGHGTETPQPGQTLELWAFTFRNEEKGFADADAAIRGAGEILVERLGESLELRAHVRRELRENGHVVTSRGRRAKSASRFEKYFTHRETVASLLEPASSHRYLAIRRGVTEQELEVAIEGAADDPKLERLEKAFEEAACTVAESPGAEVLRAAARTALRERVLPGIELELHKALKQAADDLAIEVFAENARRLLLAPPFGPRPVLGVETSGRDTWTAALIDGAGGHVSNAVLRVKGDENRAAAQAQVAALVREHGVLAVAIGGGAHGREAERLVRAALAGGESPVPVVLVDDAGSAAHAATEGARVELPALGAPARAAVSIARRLQDPLAELVKLEARHVGVGQYQHDVPPHRLKQRLDQVVASCVNEVGVDPSGASEHLLAHVAGVGPALARAIVEYRERHGRFGSRRALLDVPFLAGKPLEQAAGFLRVRGGENPLDDTGVHPERYDALERFVAGLGKQAADLLGAGAALVAQSDGLGEELGPLALRDVASELEHAGRDPRGAFVPFHFREDVHQLKDLAAGMICPGIVTNVTSFGAFVDVGVGHDGLVHVSQLADRFVREPSEVVSPGDRVRVRVLEANTGKGQISFSMKLGERPTVEGGDGRRTGGPAGEGRRAPERSERREGRAAGRPSDRDARDRRSAPGGQSRSFPARVGTHGGRGSATPGGSYRPDAARGTSRARADGDRGGRAGDGSARAEDGRPRGGRPGERRGEGGPPNAAPPAAPARPRPQEPFNNPFAALLAIRDSFKPKP